MFVNYLMTFFQILYGILMTAGSIFGWVSFFILLYEHMYCDDDD